MGLIQSFEAQNFNPNEIILNWLQPLDFNNTTDEIVITKTNSSFPMELFNPLFPTKATDSRPIEIFRGSTIVGLNSGTVSVIGSVLTDTSANFSTTPPLNGRLLRDSSSQVFQIVSNTTTTVTVSEGSPVAGQYIILADFPTTTTIQQNFEVDARTSVGPGFISNLVQVDNGSLLVTSFTQDQYVNLIFIDGAGVIFIVKSNDSSTLNFFETGVIPTIGVGMALLPSFRNSEPTPYLDNFLTVAEADIRAGSHLESNTFYYYAGFTIPIGANVAQAEFAIYGSANSTQTAALSVIDRSFGSVLYNLWASLYRELDTTEDLQDLMDVFGFQFNEIHSLIDTFTLQNAEKVYVNALLPLSEQTGLPSIGYVIGSDTLRRIATNMIPLWELKGSKQGISEFIRMITTWDITNGTGNFSEAISDFLPNIQSLRFYDPSLGNTNTRMSNTDPFVAGGRFVRTLPGIVIPGFFTFREFVITISNVALFLGSSTAFTTSGNTTTMTDSTQDFGGTDSLVGNFLLPNQNEINDIYQIVSNTSTSLTVQGIVNNQTVGGNYVVLSPLNTNRFKILNSLLPEYIPYGTLAGFIFN